MAKFLLVDPSITGWGGHYLEYASRVLGAAESAGFSPILASNVAFPTNTGKALPYVVEPVFRFDIWGCDPSRGQLEINPPTGSEKATLRRIFSRTGLAWSIVNSDQHTLDYVRETGLPSRLRDLVLRLLPVRESVVRIVDSWKIESSASSAIDEAMATRNAVAVLLAGLEAPVPEFGLNCPRSRKLMEASRATDAAADFTANLAALMQRHSLGIADVVFLPTMSWTDLRGLTSVLRSLKPRECPLIVPLFRRNIFDSYPSEYQARGYTVHAYRHLFASVPQGIAARVRICTDTEPLTEQYREVSPYAVGTLPIPCPAVPVRRKGQAEGGSLRVVYLGDARAEKGFDALPLIAEASMAEPLRNKLRLLSQYYFPPRSNDVRMMRAGELLRLHAPHRAELIEGALDSDAYAEMIRRADAMLVVYDRGNYAARSSGIFMEALCAGVPVVTTAGTWMAGVIDKITADYHAKTIGGREVLADIAMDSLECRQYRTHPGDDVPSAFGRDLEFAVRPGVVMYVKADVPGRDTTHAWVTFAGTPESRGHFVAVTVAMRGSHDQVLTERVVVLGGSSSDEFSLVLPVPSGAEWVWIGFSAVFTERPIMWRDIRLRWLRRETPIARCAAGVTTITLSGAVHSDLLQIALPELIRDFDEIRRTAGCAAPAFAEEHRASTLIARILSNYPLKSPVRGMRAFRWK